MADGSDAIADWPLLNALVNTSSGATWVSIHHGGGVGIGRSIHAGMVAVADGTDLAAEKLERVLTDRPRHRRHPPRRRRLRPRHRGRRRPRHPPPDARVMILNRSQGQTWPRNPRRTGRIAADEDRGRLRPRRGGLRARRRRRRARRAGPGGDRGQPGRPVAARQAGQRRRRRGVHRGLLQLAAPAGDRALHRRVRRGRDRRRADGLADRAPVPRPRAGQGAGHPPAHAVAPGPAVLQHRRPPERQHVVPRRPGAARVDAAVRRRLPPRRVVHAPDVPRRPGQVVPRGHARRAARHRRPPRRLHDPRLGAGTRRRRVLPHAHAARRRRRRRHPAPAGAVGALPRRRHRPRPAPVADVAAVPRARRRAAGRRADGPPAVPRPVDRQRRSSSR